MDLRIWGQRMRLAPGKMPASLGQASSTRHQPLVVGSRCRVESASTIEFRIDPQIRDERVKDGGKEHRLAARVRHCLPCLCAAPGLYILSSSSIYLHSSYNVSMTTRKWLAFQNEEGSNTCALPCGVGGFGWGVGQVGDDRK